MINNINNLGDYGTIWKELKLYDGSKDALFNAIGANAVAQSKPGIIFKTLLFTAPVILGLGFMTQKGIKIVKVSEEAKLKEPELKESLEKELQTDQKQRAHE